MDAFELYAHHLQDAFTARVRWRIKCLETRTRVTYAMAMRHKCTVVCEWVQVNDVFVCLHSGNVHICIRELCTDIYEAREFSMCMLTSKRYPLMMVSLAGSDHVSFRATVSTTGAGEGKRSDGTSVPGAGSGGSGNSLSVSATSAYAMSGAGGSTYTTRGSQVVSLTRPLEFLENNVREIIQHLLSPIGGDTTGDAASSSAGSATLGQVKIGRGRGRVSASIAVAPAAAASEGPVRHERKEKTTRKNSSGSSSVAVSPLTVSSRRFQKRERKLVALDTIPDAFYERMKLLCVSLWKRVQETETFKLNKKVYDFRYHCIVVMYLAVKGLKTKSVVIPKETILIDGLPYQSDLKRYSIIPRTFTETDTLFRQCAQEMDNKAASAAAAPPSSFLTLGPVAMDTSSDDRMEHASANTRSIV